MNTLRNNAENSISKFKSVHAEKIDGISQDWQELRSSLRCIDKMKFGFDSSAGQEGKILFMAANVNFAYSSRLLWTDNLNFQIMSGAERTKCFGKTTLIKLILGGIEPQTGIIYRAGKQFRYSVKS